MPVSQFGFGPKHNSISQVVRMEEEEDEPANMNMIQMVKWSVKENKKQEVFGHLRSTVKLDHWLSTFVLILAIVDIEMGRQYGLRLDADLVKTPPPDTTPSDQIPYYAKARPVCWRKLHHFGYISDYTYGSLVQQAVSQFDVHHEISKIRFITAEELYGLTLNRDSGLYTDENTTLVADTGSTYKNDFLYLEDNQVRYQVPENLHQPVIRLVILLITLYQLLARMRYYQEREHLYRSQHVFEREKGLSHYCWRLFEMVILILHLPPCFTHILSPGMLLFLQMSSVLRYIQTQTRQSENSRQAQLIESTVKETLLLERMSHSPFSNRRNTSELVREFMMFLVYSAYVIFAFERDSGMCVSFSSAVWLTFSACTNLGMVRTAMPVHPLSVFIIFMWSGLGVIIWALVIDGVARKRVLEPESRKIVASYEQKRANFILRDTAASVIQAIWKSYKSKCYLAWRKDIQDRVNKAKNLRPDLEGSAEQVNAAGEEMTMISEDIAAELCNKIWLFKKIRRELILVRKSLARELAMDDTSRTLDDHCHVIRQLEKLSKKACDPLRYQDDEDDWDDFRTNWGRNLPQSNAASAMSLVGRRFTRGLKSVVNSTVFNQSLAKSRRKTRRYSVSGYRVLYGRKDVKASILGGKYGVGGKGLDIDGTGERSKVLKMEDLRQKALQITEEDEEAFAEEEEEEEEELQQINQQVQSNTRKSKPRVSGIGRPPSFLENQKKASSLFSNRGPSTAIVEPEHVDSSEKLDMLNAKMLQIEHQISRLSAVAMSTTQLPQTDSKDQS